VNRSAWQDLVPAHQENHQPAGGNIRKSTLPSNPHGLELVPGVEGGR
jgi:hypothetical protein